MRLSLTSAVMFAAFSCFATTVSAQVGQLNGGGATGGAATGGQANGGTTQGLGGLTTQGPAGNAAATNNTTQTFVGAPDPTANFVGAGLQTDRNNTRQFRAITQNGVPVGGSTATSGTPRQIPVSLKIGFAVPAAAAQARLIPRTGIPFNQVATTRPELRSVQISVAKGVAVLVGQVPSESSRRLAANLVRLRPGVKKIDNRILIAKPALKPQPVLPRS